jgi:hypothetical protein
MAAHSGPNGIENGLLLSLDAGNSKSYPGSGTTWTDLSKSGYNGTLVNGPTYSNTSGGALTFDNSNDYVNIAAETPFRMGTPNFTMDIVFFYVGGSINVPLMGKRAWYGNYDQYNLAIYNGNPYTGGVGNVLTAFYRKDGGSTSNDRTTNYTLPSSGVYYASVVSSTSELNLYVNGISRATSTVSLGSNPTYNVPDVNFIIGFANSGTYFNSRIHHVKFYNRTLTANEVRENFNSIRTRFNL